MSIADQINVNTRYTRSINVERDRGSPSIVDAYLPTARSIDLLEGVTAALGQTDQPRAWSLVGPYGSGKSSFALFLHELLGPPGAAKKAAGRSLAAERPDLARRFARQDSWCRVVLTGSEEPLAARLLGALDEAATNFWGGKPGRKPAVIEELRRARRRRKLADSELLELVDGLQGAIERNGAGGLLIIIDELGKFLEHEARQGGGGVYLLQQLAERAYRARKANLLFFVLLHQGFDLYARGMGERLKNDWAKVQGRFESVSFVEAPEQTLRVVAAAFSNSLTESEHQSVAKHAKRTANALARAKALPTGLDADGAGRIFASCYPIHPISLLVLPQLCQKFAQNERTLFSYLGSREPHGFQDSLASLAKFGDRVHPDQIYDYFVHNQPAVLADPLTHRRWAEVVTAVERVEDADGTNEILNGGTRPSVMLAKTIGVLNLISRSDGLKASEGILRRLFPNKQAFRDAMQPLLDSSVVQFRRFSGEYRVWQGTDFDIDERTDEERDKLGEFDLAAALGDRGAAEPVLARRHSIRTGSLRHFDISFVDARSPRLAPTTNTDHPRIVFFLAESHGDEKAFTDALTTAGPNEVWALHKNTSAVRAAISDVLALEGVQRSGQELAGDPIAAREVRERLQAARTTEREVLGGLIGDPTLSEWHWRGELLALTDRRTLQHVLSDVMDCIYADAPIIRNELINRDRLSSQAAAARNKLFQHMLADEAKPGLHIQKYPPERAIYRSVLEKGRLHVKAEAGWAFVPPDAEDSLHLGPTWMRLDALLAASEAEPVTLARLMEALAEPPFGVKRGVFPILFLHYYLLHRYEIALYDEGTYAPALTYEYLERMVRRPDLFSFQRFRIDGVRVALFDEYGRALFGEVRESVQLLDLARPLSQFVLNLDEHAQKTRRLTDITLRVRQAFFLSKSPEKFLFNELPAACGFDDGEDFSGFASRLIDALRELKGAQSALREFMRQALCTSFALADTMPLAELRAVLRGRCHGLDQYTVDVKGLRSFIRRVCEPATADEEWFDSVLLFLGHKPSAKWTDQDRDTAEYRLAEFSKRLLDIEKLRLHFDSTAKQDSAHEVILLKAVSSLTGETDEVVTLNERTRAAIANAKQRVEEVLSDIHDNELALALVAELTSDFLARHRQSTLSKSDTTDASRKVR